MTDKMTINSELHARLYRQARNLLFEYRYAPNNPGYVPCEVVQRLMQLYGNLIAQEIYKDQEEALKKADPPVDMLKLAGLPMDAQAEADIRAFCDEVVINGPPETKGPCLKQRVIAVCTVDGKVFVGENWIKRTPTVCPRIGSKSGEDYHLCKQVCGQSGHAEIDLIKNAGGDLKGNDVYIYGHTYACDDCKQALKKANSGDIIIQ